MTGSTESRFINGSGQTPHVWNGAIGPEVGDADLIAGDFSGDGLTDLTAFLSDRGKWTAWRANGEGFNAPVVWAEWDAASLWTDSLAADFNGDELVDVATRDEAGEWIVGISDGTSFVSHSFGFWSTNVAWHDVQTADLNGDGLADILGRASTGTWVGAVSEGDRFQTREFGAWTTRQTWHDVQTGDVNGDGFADVIGRASNGRWVVGLSDSTSFDMLSFGTWSTNVDWEDVTVGDVNGDGRADVIGRASTGTWVAGISNGSQMTTVRFGGWSNRVSWHDVSPGDFNDDGLLDLAGRDQYGRWWMARSNGSRFLNEQWGGWSPNTTWDNVLTGNFFKAEDDTRERRVKLETVVKGLHAYHEAFHQFPVDNVPELLDADGRPFLSWRVHILPFLGYGDLYQQFRLDEPWDSPHNIALIDQMPDVFRTRGLEEGTDRSGFRLFEGNGAYGYDAQGGPTLDDALDGDQQTLFVMETMSPDAVAWTQPDEIPLNPTDPLGGLTLPPDYFLASTVDGILHEVNPNVDPANFAATVTWDGGELLTTDQFADVYLDWAAPDSRETSLTKLNAIALAFLQFHDVHLRFPPGGSVPAEWFDPATGLPYLSWRVHLLPFLGYSDLYGQFHFDEPWDSPHNMQLLDKMPEEFRSRGLAPGGTTSAFKLITGPEAYAVDYVPGGSQSGGPPSRDAFDGPGNTILVVELMPDKAVPWTQWNEVEYSASNPLNGIGPIPADGLHVVLWNGATRTIAPTAKPQNVGIFATTNEGEIFGPAESENAFFDWQIIDSTTVRTRKLKDIGLAFHLYHNRYTHFPVAQDSAGWWDPTTRLPNLSWRVHLLPHLGFSSLYDQFRLDEPWDSPHNIQLLDKMPEIFRTRAIPADSHLTALKLFIGEEAYAYETDDPDLSRWRGPALRDIHDARGNTILAVELLADQAVEWTRPDGDIFFDPAEPLAGVGTIPTGGLLALLFDGNIKTISPSVTPDNFKTFVTTDGGEVFGYAETSNVFFDWQRPTFSAKHDFPSFLVADSSARRNNLRSVGIALHNYHDVFRHFPVAPGSDFGNYDPQIGQPHLSWRVHILPFLGYASLYNQFHLDEPWDSPHNIQLLDKMPEFYRSRGLPADSTKTGLQVFLGEGAWTYHFSQGSSAHGPRIRDIADFIANTIAVIETMPEDAVEWTRPDGDIAWDPADPYGGLTMPPDFFLVMMFDTRVRAFHPWLDEEEFRAFVTFAGGEPITYDD